MNPEEEEEQQSRRPKVVDKRISAGGHAPSRPDVAGSVPGPPADLGREDRRSSQAVSERATDPPTPARDHARGAEPAASQPDAKRSGGQGADGPPPEQVWTPEQEEQARQMVEEIVRVPSLDWVLNAAVNLANVAGTQIEMGAAADAQIAIDAFAALVNGLSGRLQDAEAPLKQTLAQLQLAFAQRAGQPPAATPPPTP